MLLTRNQVWSNNGDIANDLEWPLTAPSTHFCKFWGFCPFQNSLFPTSATFRPIFTKFGRMMHIGPPNRTGSSVSQLWAFMFVVHTSNCYGQNCTRRAIFRLGIDTLIANILVGYISPAFVCLIVCLSVYLFVCLFVCKYNSKTTADFDKSLHVGCLHCKNLFMNVSDSHKKVCDHYKTILWLFRPTYKQIFLTVTK